MRRKEQASSAIAVLAMRSRATGTNLIKVAAQSRKRLTKEEDQEIEVRLYGEDVPWLNFGTERPYRRASAGGMQECVGGAHAVVSKLHCPIF